MPKSAIKMVSFDKTAQEVKVEKIEELRINRQDAYRGRLRTKSKSDEDIIINLPRGKTIENEDVFGPSHNGIYYKVIIDPEPVIKVTLDKSQTKNLLESAIKLGYGIGSRHLEVLMENGAVFIPVTIGEEKIKRILESIKLPITFESVQKVISTSAEGYHPGEQEE